MSSATPPRIYKVKDLAGDERFEGIHPNLPECPSCCILVGAIKSSKSNLIINMLCSKEMYLDRFEIVRVMSTTLHMDNKGKLMDKYFDCDDHYEDKFIDDIIESQGKFSKEDRPTYCLVLDDCLTADFCKRNNKLAFFMTKMRHYIDMCIISVQSLNHIPALIRGQARDIIIARQNNYKEVVNNLVVYWVKTVIKSSWNYMNIVIKNRFNLCTLKGLRIRLRYFIILKNVSINQEIN